MTRSHALDIPALTEQRVTVLDDRSTACRDEDLRRLEDYSTAVGFGADRAESAARRVTGSHTRG